MTDRRRPNVRDSNGDPIRPGSRVTYRGEEREVLALWHDSSDDTDLDLVVPPDELSVATSYRRVRASDVSLVQ